MDVTISNAPTRTFSVWKELPWILGITLLILALCCVLVSSVKLPYQLADSSHVQLNDSTLATRLKPLPIPTREPGWQLDERLRIWPTSPKQWLRLSVGNPLTSPREFFIHTDYPGLERVVFYRETDRGELEQLMAWGHDTATPKGYHRTAGVRLHLSSGQSLTVWVEIFNPEMTHFSLYLTPVDLLMAYTAQVNINTGLYNGIQLMSLFCLALVVFVRMPMLVFYGLYLLGSMLFLSDWDGSQTLVAPPHWMPYKWRAILVCCNVLLYLQFTRLYLAKYLRTRPQLDRAMLVMMTGVAVLACLVPLIAEPLLAELVATLTTFVAAFGFGVAINCYLGGMHRARYLVYAWFPKTLICALVPFWRAGWFDIDVATLQLSVRFAWILELAAVAAATGYTMKRHLQRSHNARVQRLMALQEERARHQYINQVIHDIRSPLTSMISLTELMQEEALPAAQYRRVNLLREQALRVNHLISNTLVKSRLKDGLPYDESPVSLVRLTKALRANFDSICQQRRMNLQFDIEDDLTQVAVLFDEVWLMSILDDVLLRSLTYCWAGTIHIRFQSQQLETHAGNLLIQVNVSGQRTAPPIPTSREQLHATVVGIEALGGEVVYEDRADGGAAFIKLPVRFGEIPTTPCYDSGQLRLLIVEDDPAMGLTMQEVLAARGLGYGLVIVPNGQTALAEFERHRFDIVVLDGQLPDMDGVELTRQLRARERAKGRAAAVIIGFTGDDDGSLRQDLQDAGADGMIPKERGIKALVEQIAHLASLSPDPPPVREAAA